MIMSNHSIDTPFLSPIWAGFECTYALIQNQTRLDLLSATKHDTYVYEDYEMLKKYGIRTVREGLSWHQIDKIGKGYDFSRFEPMMKAAKDLGIEQIWDLNHFDYPEDLDPYDFRFVARFTEYAKACVQTIRRYKTHGTLYMLPLNEISFWSWIGGMVGVWAPYRKGRDNELELKKQYVRACLAAQEAIWSIDLDVRFIHADPILHRKPRTHASQKEILSVEYFNEQIKYTAWDMICGKAFPELGGDPKYLDIIGLNYYVDNQEWTSTKTDDQGNIIYREMGWNSPGRISFAVILQEIYERYQRPIILSETGSYGSRRTKWWKRLITEVEEAQKNGVPMQGICAYPILDQPPEVPIFGRFSGLFDFPGETRTYPRIPQEEPLAVIQDYIQKNTSPKKPEPAEKKLTINSQPNIQFSVSKQGMRTKTIDKIKFKKV
jgi:beta-glucosidase/6-phospho-beta-glucosidase/beta-galactosidase